MTVKSEPTVVTQEPNTTSKVADVAHDAVDKAARQAEKAEAKVRDSADQAREKTQELTNSISDYMHEHPIASLGIAFAAGLMMSSMMRK